MRLLLQLDLPADASLLPRTRHAIAGYVEALGGNEDDVSDVVLALDEACANVIKHAVSSVAVDGDIPQGDPNHHYSLCAELSDDLVVLEVTDDGHGFVVEDVVGRPDDLGAESGRGLRIISRLMHGVEVESPTAEGGTRLRMSKRLSPHYSS